MNAQIERLDDIPVIFGYVKSLKMIEFIDSYFIPHKNWKGITLGELTAVWLCYLISTQDHRLSYLADWAESRLTLLSALLSKQVSNHDFADDKLEILLDIVSNQSRWNQFEDKLNRHTVWVYDLKTDILRVDATVGKSFKEIIANGLMQYGNSKHFRNDLPQFKTMLCTLDPLGYPICSLTVSGNSADDPLYIPVIARAISVLTQLHSLFVGDCKLGSISTRAFIVAKQHDYLCPLADVQLKTGELNDYIDNIEAQNIKLEEVLKDDKKIAEGYSTTKELSHSSENGETTTWTEKRFIVRSFSHAKTQTEAFDKRITKCINELSELNNKGQGKKAIKDIPELESKCEKIIKTHKMSDIISYEITKEETKKQIRKYKDNPAHEEIKTDYTVKILVDDNKILEQKKRFGWRVYASNCTDKDFNVEKIVLIYRKEYIIERMFNCLKNKPLNLTPLYLQKDNRIEGLINILLLALRIISLVEYQVSTNLEKSGEKLAGLYAGNPKHVSDKPSAVLILRVFLHIYCIATPNFQESQLGISITELSLLQKKLLRLLGLPETLYTDLNKSAHYQHEDRCFP